MNTTTNPFQAESLEKPWGDCGAKQLNFSNVYRFSECEVECETKQLLSACGCRDGYMPGYNAGL